MAIDPSILQRFSVQDNAPVLNMFQNALTAQKSREAQEVQTQRQQESLTADQQKNRLRSLAEFSATIAPDIKTGNIPAVRERVVARLEELPKQGMPTAESRKILDLIDDPTISNEDKVAQLGQFANTSQSLALQFGVIEPTGAAGAGRSSQKAFAPVTLVNPATGEKRLASPVVDSLTGEGRLSPLDIPAGFEISKETDSEKRAANVVAEGAKARQKITGKGQAERRQIQIDRGLEAADGFANVQRAVDLLEVLDTGGVDAASLRAKQLFGVEGADEAELSNRMGKAVLSQLKATFGAAFTAKEGDSLARIEAGFGKSTAGNKRLLEQTKRIILRAAKRGIRAARAEGDMDTVRDIEESLAFRLDVKPEGGAAAQQPGVVRFNRQGQRVQ